MQDGPSSRFVGTRDEVKPVENPRPIHEANRRALDDFFAGRVDSVEFVYPDLDLEKT